MTRSPLIAPKDLDAVVLAAVRDRVTFSVDGPTTAAAILVRAHAKLGLPLHRMSRGHSLLYRPVDRSLQRLRKAGLIVHRGPRLGWAVVQQAQDPEVPHA